MGDAPTVVVKAQRLDDELREQLRAELETAEFVRIVRDGAPRRGKPHSRRNVSFTLLCRKAIDAVDAVKEVSKLIATFFARISEHAERVAERRAAYTERRKVKRTQAAGQRQAHKRRTGPVLLYGNQNLQEGFAFR